MIRPWEYGNLPGASTAPMNERVDEVWLPSNYVRDCYVRSGVAPSRVVVIPNGVDTRERRPDVLQAGR